MDAGRARWLAAPAACRPLCRLGCTGPRRADIATAAWILATLAVLGALVFQVVTSLTKGDVGLDLVALLSMGGALALSQPLAGAVIALMYASGQSLEAYASRPRRQGDDRADRAPAPDRPARGRRGADGGAPRGTCPGRPYPGARRRRATGRRPVAAGRAILDRSSLTGEALPVNRHRERARAERDRERRHAVHLGG